jgi:hypothetical protein
MILIRPPAPGDRLASRQPADGIRVNSIDQLVRGGIPDGHPDSIDPASAHRGLTRATRGFRMGIASIGPIPALS